MLLLLALACRGPGGPPPLEAVTRVVTVGDNVAANPTWSTSYPALLARNDDALFPMFAGKDLDTLLPDAEMIRLERGGDSYYALAATPAPLCVCGACAAPCLEPGDPRPTLLVVALGMNDLVASALRLVNDGALRDEPEPLLSGFRRDVATVLAAAADPELFPTPPLLVVANITDPSDGQGDIAELVTSFFPFPGADQVTPDLARAVIDGFNASIAEEAAAAGGEVADVHAAFLGHGYHYDDPANPHHQDDDATRWLSTVIDPNLRGAHEIRRVLWASLTGEHVDGVPTGLPVPATSGLPPVPDDGWAKAVLASEVSAEITSGETTYPNLASDPQKAVGPPGGGSSDIVAIGVLGAWLTLDLGEGTVAHDGEGEDLVVLEFGALSGGTPEPYRVLVAEEPDGPWVHLGDAHGERAFDLADAGVARARYVRVESLAQLAEVLGGLGSPYYPGPELDAVGAVWPGP